MRHTLFPLLVSSPGKRYVELAEGTHTIVMEKNRLKLFEAVQAFLDEKIGYMDIPVIIKGTMDAHTPTEAGTVEDVRFAVH